MPTGDGWPRYAHVVTGKPMMELTQLSIMIGRLNIEINTGMRSRVSTLRAVNMKYGTHYRKKEDALRFCQELREWSHALYGVPDGD